MPQNFQKHYFYLSGSLKKKFNATQGQLFPEHQLPSVLTSAEKKGNLLVFTCGVLI